MARGIRDIARELGAEQVARVPDTGGGALGAARLAQLVGALQERLRPAQGLRPGRPTSKNWRLRSKIPMSLKTRHELDRLARKMSTTKRKVSPMQVAAHLLEEAVACCTDQP